MWFDKAESAKRHYSVKIFKNYYQFGKYCEIFDCQELISNSRSTLFIEIEIKVVKISGFI
jgi:hypothetical protein